MPGNSKPRRPRAALSTNSGSRKPRAAGSSPACLSLAGAADAFFHTLARAAWIFFRRERPSPRLHGSAARNCAHRVPARGCARQSTRRRVALEFARSSDRLVDRASACRGARRERVRQPYAGNQALPRARARSHARRAKPARAGTGHGIPRPLPEGLRHAARDAGHRRAPLDHSPVETRAPQRRLRSIHRTTSSPAQPGHWPTDEFQPRPG